MKPVIIYSLIILNSIIIFVEPFFIEYSKIFFILDSIFNIVFVSDIIINIRKNKKYLSDITNLLDFFIVIGAFMSIFFHGLSFLVLFRLFRLLKIFRLFKFIPNIDRLISSVKNVFKTSVFIILSFIIYLFIVSNLSYIMFNKHSEYFEDPIESLYTTFQIFTLEGWYEIPESMENSLNKTKYNLTRLYFVLVLLSGGIFGLSLINSIFVDSVLMDDNDRIMEKLKNIEEKISDNN